MGKYQAYPEYKDSGMGWGNQIPKHWVEKKIKWEITASSGVDQKNDDGVFDLYGANGIIGKSNSSCINQRRGVVLVGRVGSAGAINFVQDVCAVSDNALIIQNNTFNVARFDFYLLLSLNLEELVSKNAQPLITASNMREIIAAVPFDEVERMKIANFLDHETAKIDMLIEKQQQLIQLLKEKRQAVISHAVTKGLNPNAPMKDSGVEWLGEVPEHWEVLTTKRFFSLKCDPAPNNNEMELLSVYTDIGVRPRKELEAKGNKASTTDGYWLVKKDDLIVNKLLAWMGAVGYSAYDGVTSPAYDILRKTKALNTKFYHYLFRTRIMQSEFKRWSRGIMEMRLRLYFDELGRIGMPFPPEYEQDEIVEAIEKIEIQYDRIIDQAEHQIQLMQERRTALISAAVTGKIDVRNWQAPQN